MKLRKDFINKRAGRLLALVLLTVMILSLAGCGNFGTPSNPNNQNGSGGTDFGNDPSDRPADDSKTTQSEIKFRIGADEKIRTYYCKLFADYLSEETDGRITGEIIESDDVISGGSMCRKLIDGELDILVGSDMAADEELEGELSFAWLPGIITNYDEAERYYNYGYLSEQLGEVMLKNDLVKMSAFSTGFRQIANAKREITKMSDFDGLKVGTPKSALISGFYSKCGTLPVILEKNNVMQAFSEKTIDAIDAGICDYSEIGLSDAIKYITELNYCYVGGSFITGVQFWKDINDVDRDRFLKAAEKISDIITEDVQKETARLVQEYTESGKWTVSQPTAEMQAALSEIYKGIIENAKGSYDKDIVEKITSGEYRNSEEG